MRRLCMRSALAVSISAACVSILPGRALAQDAQQLVAEARTVMRPMDAATRQACVTEADRAKLIKSGEDYLKKAEASAAKGDQQVVFRMDAVRTLIATLRARPVCQPPAQQARPAVDSAPPAAVTESRPKRKAKGKKKRRAIVLIDPPLDRPARQARSPKNRVYAKGSLFNSRSCSARNPVSTRSVGIDPNIPGEIESCDSALGGGIGLGTEVLGVPVGPTEIIFGLEGSLLFPGGGSNSPGTPALTPLGVPTNDLYGFKDNHIVLFGPTARVPVTDTISIFTSVGGAWGDKTVSYNCVTLCDFAGTPRFSGTRDVNMSGWFFSLGAQATLPVFMPNGAPLALSLDWTRIDFGDKTVSFAAPAPFPTAVSFSVGQDIDIFRASIVVPIISDPNPPVPRDRLFFTYNPFHSVGR